MLSEEEQRQLHQLNNEGIRASWRRGTSIPDDVAQKIESNLESSDESSVRHETAKDLAKIETSEIPQSEDDNPPDDVVRFEMDYLTS